MKRITLILIMLIAITILSAESTFYKKSNWLGKDKIMHFSGSAFLTLWTYGLCHEYYSNSKDQSLLISFSITSLIGISKEYRDLKLKSTGWSWHDLIYDLAGIGFGFVLINNFDVP